MGSMLIPCLILYQDGEIYFLPHPNLFQKTPDKVINIVIGKAKVQGQIRRTDQSCSFRILERSAEYPDRFIGVRFITLRGQCARG